MTDNENTCVCCGDAIPEGRQLCPRCESDLKDGGGEDA